MVCFIVTGEIMSGGKYFGKFFLNFKIIFSFLSVPDEFANTMINDDI